MEQLIELVNIVSKNKAKTLDTVGNFPEKDNLLKRLYDGIADGRFKNDIEATDLLFPGASAGSQNYTKLKRRLYQRLINSVFFIDVNKPEYDELRKAYYTSYKDFAALKILIGKGAIKTSVPLAESILKRARRFEFTDLVVNVLRELQLMYAGPKADQKNFEKCNRLLKQYSEVFHAELLAAQYYNFITIQISKSRASRPELAATARKFSEELRKHAGRFQTYRFIMFAYNVFALSYQIESDYFNTLKVCSEAVQLLQKKGSMRPRVTIFLFREKMASCQIQLGQYQESEKSLEENLKLVDKGSLNWYVAHEYLMISYFHSGNYQKAFRVFLDVCYLPAFKHLPAHYHEHWKIFETYLHYFIAINEIKPDLQSQRRFGTFRPGKFLNEVPVYSKDKRGSNITILVLQVLFLIKERKYEEVSDKLESLKYYSHRYLRKDETYRSNVFIHMLMQLPKGHFNKKAVERHADKYILKLKGMPLELSSQSVELEIVPYEKLWKFVITSLKG
jgi:hypothetical protein